MVDDNTHKSIGVRKEGTRRSEFTRTPPLIARMGCLQSKESTNPGVNRGRDTENQVNLILQAKHQRANVFTAATLDENFRPANIPKNSKQQELISELQIYFHIFHILHLYYTITSSPRLTIFPSFPRIRFKS